jgi:hypothetical protein
MTVPPTPLRIGISIIILALVQNQSLSGTSSKDIDSHNVASTPYYSPLWGILHILAVHTSSLWSDRVHSASSTLLLESSIYYALVQAAMMGIIHAYSLLDNATLWITASHCSAYYAWFVITTARILPNSTLSYICLYISMLTFCCCTVPYVISSNILPHSINTYSYFVSWSLADICSYFHNYVLAPKIKVTSMITP